MDRTAHAFTVLSKSLYHLDLPDNIFAGGVVPACHSSDQKGPEMELTSYAVRPHGFHPSLIGSKIISLQVPPRYRPQLLAKKDFSQESLNVAKVT